MLTINKESWPINGQFRISRGTKTMAEVVTVRIAADGIVGMGECVPYGRYGETLASVCDQLSAADQFSSLPEIEQFCAAMPAGAARNALDCALWDLRAKQNGIPASATMGIQMPKPLTTAYTLSLDTPQSMGHSAAKNAHRPLLKIKLGGENDIECMQAVAANAPQSRLIVDANEGWNTQTLRHNIEAAARLGVALIEQPLPAGNDALLGSIERLVPICADESVHTADDLEQLAGLYDAVNIKLDKAGGLTGAIALRDRAVDMGFAIMVGCMVGTSLAMAPAVLLAQNAQFVDLDGPLLLAKDRDPALKYDGSDVSPPQGALWG